MIVEPALRAGVKVEPALVERLLADAAGDTADETGRLPLLQETLVLLWDHMEGGWLTLHAYDQLGGEKRTGISVALAKQADSVLAKLSEAQKALARRIFLSLVAFSKGRPDTRRQQPLSTLQVPGDDPAVFAATLEALTRGRLLTLSVGKTDADKQVDLAHEALITGWDTLQKWLTAYRDAEQARRQLEDKAAEWVDDKRGLLDDVELAEAIRCLRTFDATGLKYSPSLNDLINASRAAILEAKQQAELNRKRESDRILWSRLAVVLAAALLVTGLLAGIVLQQNTSLERQSRILSAQALAASSVSQLDIDPERSVLLAMEAVSTTRRLGEPVVPQAEEALHQAIVRSHVRNAWRAHNDDVTSVAYSPGGQRIATTSKDNRIRIWDPSGNMEKSLEGHTDRVNSVEFSPDGTLLITGSDDETLRQWNIETGLSTILLDLPDRTGYVLDAAYSPDGKSIAVAVRDGRALIWDTVEARVTFTFTGHTERVTSVTYSPGGEYVLSASWDHTVQVWDPARGTTIHVLKGHMGLVTSAAFSPDGSTIISASEDLTARIWNAATGKELRILRGHNDWITSVAYGPNGDTIVTTSRDYTAKVWKAASGEELYALHGHNDWVNAATYDRDGRTIATVSRDHTVRFWDATVGQFDQVLSVVYSRSGNFILAAGLTD